MLTLRGCVARCRPDNDSAPQAFAVERRQGARPLLPLTQDRAAISYAIGRRPAVVDDCLPEASPFKTGLWLKQGNRIGCDVGHAPVGAGCREACVVSSRRRSPLASLST